MDMMREIITIDCISWSRDESIGASVKHYMYYHETKCN